MKVALLLPVLAAAEICTEVFAPTGFVFTVKVPLEAPAATVMLAGMDATAPAPLRTVNVTTVFWLSGAGKVTFPIVLLPPVTEVGEKLSDEGIIGLTVKVANFVAPLAVAEILTLVDTVVWFVCIVQVAVLNPAGTITDVGIELTAEPPLTTARETVVLIATEAFKVTLPVVLRPPRIELGDTVTDFG